MPGKTLPFRLYAQILIFSALVALGALVLWPLQRAMQGGMTGIRDDLIAMMESRIDRKIKFSSISPSILGSFDVRNVRIMGEDEHPLLTISRFRVAYSLLDLLRGRPQGIYSVWIDAPYVDFDADHDNDLVNLFKNLNAGDNTFRQNVSSLLPEKFVARIRGGKCLVSSGRDSLEVDVPNFNIEIVNGRIILDGKWAVGISKSSLRMEPVNLYALMGASGSFKTDLEEGEAVFSIASISGDAVSEIPIAFGLVLENNSLRLGKMPSGLPFGFSLEYGIGDGKIDAQMDCTSFRPGDFLSFSGGLEGASQLLDVAASGTAFFERRADGSMGYMVGLSGENISNSPHSLTDGASFAIKAAGNETYASIDNFFFSMPPSAGSAALFFGDVSFSGVIGFGPLAPEGTFSLANFSLSGAESVNADIAVLTRDDRIVMRSEAMNVGAVELRAVRAEVQISGSDAGFSISARHSGGTGLFSMEGSMNSNSWRTRANLHLESFAAGDLACLSLPFVKNASIPAPIASALNAVPITAEAVVVTDFVHYFELSGGRFGWDGNALSLSLKAELSDRNNMGFSVNAGYRGIDYFVEGAVLEGKSVNIRGSHGLNVILASAGTGYAGSMSASGFPIPFLGHPAHLSFAADLRYRAHDSWDMEMERFELGDIVTPSGLALVRVSGSADQTGVIFPMLYYRDSVGPLSGRADVSWHAEYSSFSGAAVMGEGTEHYRLEGSFAKEHLNLVFSGAAVRLERMLGNKANARADGDIRVFWDSSNYFNAELNLQSVRGRLYDQEFGASARAVLDKEKIAASSLNFSFSGLQGTVSRLVVDGSKGMVETNAEITGSAGGKPVQGGLLLSAGFKPLQSWLDAGDMLNEISGKLRVEGLKYGSGGESQTFDIVFSRQDGAFSLSGGPREMMRFNMDSGGNFYAGLSSPFPVRGTLIGSISNKMIDARCGDLYVDMAGLFDLLPENHDIYLTGGYVNAAVDIRGSLSDPEFFGTARGSSLRIRVPEFVSQEMRPIPFNVAIDGNEMRFGPVATVVGKGTGTVTGWFRFDRWIPNIFSLDIAVPRDTPIPYAFDINGFTAKGDAAGNLNVSMENLIFDISGDLYANNSELGINSEEIINVQGANPFAGALFPFVVNLTINTGPVVEFFYPTARFPILRANPEMGTRLRVTADSLSQQYSINSDIKIRSGEVFYFERRFYIRSGTLTFRENEIRFEPRLTARAEVRDRTDDGPVTISMIVENAPLLSFTARFESNPPLPQMEIFALLGHSITGAQSDENSSSLQRAFLNSGSELLAQYIIGRQLEQQIRNFMKLDMFNVRTHVLQNAFYMQAGLMPQPVDRTNMVGNYFDNTTVFGGKYIGQDMFVQGMLSMRYDANNTSFGGITLAPDFGIELQNPLFSIRWDFNPTHPENWFVNDNSVTLTRTFTF